MSLYFDFDALIFDSFICSIYLFFVTKICDAVAVAKILNATLVIPHLEVNPVWQDSRYFMSKTSVQSLLVSVSYLRRSHICEFRFAFAVHSQIYLMWITLLMSSVMKFL